MLSALPTDAEPASENHIPINGADESDPGWSRQILDKPLLAENLIDPAALHGLEHLLPRDTIA